MERMAAGVVQQTKSTTMEMRTRTSIRSSGLWRDFLRLEDRWVEVLARGGGRGGEGRAGAGPQSGQRERRGPRVVEVRWREAAGEEGGLEARRLLALPGMLESE